MPTVYGFPPIADIAAKTLILGTMPGSDSLNAQEYYANSRNTFWRIMSDLLWEGQELAYTERLRKLSDTHIALWDVIAVCERTGSLDSNIQKESIQINNFAALFKAHSTIQRICFNGQDADKLFRRHVLPTLATPPALIRLPSTSPAHAAMNYAAKRAAWAAALGLPGK